MSHTLTKNNFNTIPDTKKVNTYTWKHFIHLLQQETGQLAGTVQGDLVRFILQPS